MQKLADEIVRELPRFMADYAKGPQAKDIASLLAVPVANVRDAFREIKDRQIAIIVRWPGAKVRHVVPLEFRFPKIRTDNRHRRVVCRWCDTLFQNGSKQFCSKTCFAQHMWSDPERRIKGSISGKRAAKLPSRVAVTERLVALQKSPEGRQRQSEFNRQKWADPAHKAKRSASIQAVNGSPEGRRKFSEHFKKNWENPEVRERACQRMREVKQDPAVKARYSAAGKKKWETPEYRKKMEVNIEAFAERNRGRVQTPEQKAKRIATRQANTIARGYYRHPNEVTRPDSKPRWKKRDDNSRG